MMKVFVDLDGVLVDFDSAVEASSLFNKKEDWVKAGENFDDLPKDIFLHAKKMHDADELVNYLNPLYEWQVLTAIPKKYKIPEARLHKFMWCKENYNIYPARINVCYRVEKQYYAAEDNLEPNVLIDDNAGNIKEWSKKGGIGILHTSASNSIAELNKLGL